MARRRGALIDIALFFLVVLQIESVVGMTLNYRVGGPAGWKLGSIKQPAVMYLDEGDSIVFEYNNSEYNVVLVDKAGYQNCRPQMGAPIHSSGYEQFWPEKGEYFYICGVPGHCEAGMKHRFIFN